MRNLPAAEAAHAKLAAALGEKRGGIGDIRSQEAGSAARFNSGKPPLELVPLRLAAYHLSRRLDSSSTSTMHAAVEVLRYLGNFQERRAAPTLARAFESADFDDRAWTDCAQVFDYGRRKYAEWNWAKGMPWSAVIGSCARHLIAMARGEVNDLESGLPHRGHVMCNLVMLATYEDTYPEGDDRPPVGMLCKP